MADMPAPIAHLYDECEGCGCLGCHASKAFNALRAVLDECDRIDGPHADWLVCHGREPEAETVRRTAANIRNAITTALEGKADPDVHETTYLILREDFGLWLVTATSPQGAVEKFRRERPGDRHRGVFEQRLHAEETKEDQS